METVASPGISFSKKSRPVGESYVWFTGIGLTLGLAMIIFLLGLIFYRGLEVFWPDRVVTLELRDSSRARIGGAASLAGVIEKKQMRSTHALDTGGEAPQKEEWQLFLGNKDLYGFSFAFVDVEDIAAVRQDADLMQLERIEYGDAFGYPVALKFGNGSTLSAEAADFIPRLRDEVRGADHRWDEIRVIEKKKIGAINASMENLRLRRKAAVKKSEPADRIQRIDAKIEGLQRDYDVLADQARTLRQMQQQNLLVYKDATGRTVELETGQLVGFYYPNRLGFIQRLGLFFQGFWSFMVEDPREANTEGGVFPAIFGTFVMTVLMSLAVTPFGVLAAIYLREYAKQGWMVRSVRIAVNNLAGVPSIVFGVFGLGFFVYFVGGSLDRIFFSDALPTPTFGTGGIFWASLTLALLTVPVVIVATEEALAAVPRGMREGSMACGASKWQTIQQIVLPAAAPGILTGLILAMARGASEVAPLMLVGVVKLAPNLPIDGVFPFVHLERKFMHLGFHIYDLGFQSPDSEAAKPMVFATTLLLISLVIVLNLGAIYIRRRLQKKYFAGTF